MEMWITNVFIRHRCGPFIDQRWRKKIIFLLIFCDCFQWWFSWYSESFSEFVRSFVRLFLICERFLFSQSKVGYSWIWIWLPYSDTKFKFKFIITFSNLQKRAHQIMGLLRRRWWCNQQSNKHVDVQLLLFFLNFSTSYRLNAKSATFDTELRAEKQQHVKYKRIKRKRKLKRELSVMCQPCLKDCHRIRLY